MALVWYAPLHHYRRLPGRWTVHGHLRVSLFVTEKCLRSCRPLTSQISFCRLHLVYTCNSPEFLGGGGGCTENCRHASSSPIGRLKCAHSTGGAGGNGQSTSAERPAFSWMTDDSESDESSVKRTGPCPPAGTQSICALENQLPATSPPTLHYPKPRASRHYLSRPRYMTVSCRLSVGDWAGEGRSIRSGLDLQPQQLGAG